MYNVSPTLFQATRLYPLKPSRAKNISSKSRQRSGRSALQTLKTISARRANLSRITLVRIFSLSISRALNLRREIRTPTENIPRD